MLPITFIHKITNSQVLVIDGTLIKKRKKLFFEKKLDCPIINFSDNKFFRENIIIGIDDILLSDLYILY